MIEQYLRQLAFVSQDNFWYPALEPLLRRTTPEQAVWTPATGGNSIWQIVQHIAYCYVHVVGRLHGEEPPWVDDENWVANPASITAEEWEEAVARLRRDRTAFAEAVRELEGHDLSTYAGKLPRSHLIEQVIQHEAYHAGQVAYLQRMQGQSPIM